MAAFAAQHFLPRERGNVDLVPVDVVSEHGAGSVGKRQAFAVRRDEIGIGHAHARRGAVPCEQHVVRPVDGSKVRDLAVIGAQDRGFELELLDRVGNPTFTEAFPRQRGHRTSAQHRPHRHFEGAGIRARHDADAVRVGKLQHLAHQVDAVGQTRLADLGAMRATKRFGGELVGGISGRLGAGTGREERARRLARRNTNSHVSLLAESTRGVGTAWPGAALKAVRAPVKRRHVATQARGARRQGENGRFRADFARARRISSARSVRLC